LVEDDETSRLYLKELLERYNCHVFYAENGQTAIDMVEKNKDIQLILMDIKMPVKDGYVATREIKKMRPDLPLIVQTAYAMDSDHEKAMEAGCDDYISKPINPDDLYKLISKYIQS